MRYNQSEQAIITKGNNMLTNSTGNVLFQKVNLSDSQNNAIAKFYSLNDADSYNGQLMEILSIYVASSCPELGELSEDDIIKKTLIVNQITDLLTVIDPLRAKLKGGK